MFGSLGRAEPEPTPTDEIRAMRVQQARSRTKWTEIDETRLVRRRRFWVDAETDELLAIHRGAIFDRAGVVAFADQRDDLRFYIDRAGEVIVLEPSMLAATWSEYVARSERRRPTAGRR